MRMSDEDMAGVGGTGGLLLRLRRRIGLFAVVFFAVAALVAITFLVLPRSYRAVASIVVASTDGLIAPGSTAQAMRQGDPADVESQMTMLRSAELLGRVVDMPTVRAALVAGCEASRGGSLLALLQHRLHPGRPCEQLVAERAEALQMLDGAMAVMQVGRSRIIELSVTSPVPETAATIANAVVDTYLQDDRARKIDTRNAAIAWLNGEIARTGEELRRAEMSVVMQRRETGNVRGQLAGISAERLSNIAQQLTIAQGAQAEASSRLARFADRGEAPPGDETRESWINRAIADIHQQLATVVTQVAQFEERYGPRHPALVEARQQQRALERRLATEYRRVGATLEREAAAANARVAELRREYDRLVNDVGQTSSAEAGMATLLRDAEVRRAIFADLSKRLNDLETERRLLAGDARLVSHAEVPPRVFFPKATPFITFGLVVSLAIAGAAALLRDRADRRLRGISRLVSLAGMPVVGQIPRVERARALQADPLPNSQPPALQEAVRALFGRCVLLPRRTPKMLLVASSEPGDGKTFLTLALARFAASTERRVLVIECDLRRPRFSGTLRMSGGAGLSEYLRGTSKLPDVITPAGAMGRLHVIRAGRPANDSLELLSGERMRELLRQARAQYDLVLLDSPPAQVLVDARLLAPLADGVIYCANWGHSRLDSVLEGLRDMQAAGGNVLGLAINNVSARQYALYENRPLTPVPAALVPVEA